MKVGLFSSAKNEGPFLLEWVAYHMLVGFTDIVIYSNDSTDGTTELLDALDESGVISHVLQDLKPDQAPQKQAAETAFDHAAFKDADWLMWLDTDEFLYCQNPDNNVIELIRKIEPSCTGITANWLNFGDGGHTSWSDVPVTQKFVRRGNPDHVSMVQFKTLFKKTNKIRGFGLHRPWFIWGYQPEDGLFVNAEGEDMNEGFYRAGGRRKHRLGESPPELVAHDWVSVCHYAVKTRDSFEIKKQRGQGTKKIGADNRSSRFRERYWDLFNRNEVYDPRMLELADRLREKMDELQAIPVIAKAHQDCLQRYRESLANLPTEKATSGSNPE